MEADIVVFGHTHIPLVYQYGEVWLINPRARASGSIFTRQLIQTVGVLSIYDDGTVRVMHCDHAQPHQLYEPTNHLTPRIQGPPNRYENFIVEPLLTDLIGELKQQQHEDVEAIRTAILPLSHQCWTGKREAITISDLRAVVADDPFIPPLDKDKVLKILSLATKPD